MLQLLRFACTLPNKILHVGAEVNIVLVVYAHRVKQFQEESGGDPSVLLIPALFDKVPVHPLFALSCLVNAC